MNKLIISLLLICVIKCNTDSAKIDPFVCLAKANEIYEDANNLIENIKDKNTTEIIISSYNILESVQPLLNECGLKIDLHIPEISFSDLRGCVVDTESLVKDIRAIKDDIIHKNFYNILQNIASAVTTLKQITNVCQPQKILSSSSIDILTCVKDSEQLYKQVDKLIKDKDNKAPLSEIVVVAYNIIESLQPLVNACGLKINLHIPVINFPDLSGCVVDSQNIVDEIKLIRDDFKRKDFQGILDHVAVVIQILKSIAQDCKPTLQSQQYQKSILSFNILKCIKSGEKVYKDVKQFIDDDKQHRPLNEIIVSAFAIIKELQPFLDECHIKADLHIPDIDFNDLNGCITDSTSIINDFKTIAQNIKDKDYLNIIVLAEGVISHIKSVVDECKIHKNSNQFVLQANIVTCVKEAKKVKNLTGQLINNFKSKNIPDILVSAYDIIENIQPLVDACIPKKIDLHIPKISFNNLHDCVVDVQNIINIISEIRKDISLKNWKKIADDAKKTITTFIAIKQDCSVSKNNLQAINSNFLVCLQKTEQTYKDVKNFLEIYKEKRPLNEIIVHAFSIIEELQPLVDACGIKVDLHIPVIEFNDLDGCVVDSQNLIKNFELLYTHLKQKDFIDIVSDSKNIVESAKNIVTECKATKKNSLNFEQ